jgi:Coenzyme PQQ synthesis protein D (PqqD)
LAEVSAMPTPLSLSSLVRWSDDQLAATVDQEVVILSVERGSYYGLDDIGSDIWQQMATPVSVGALCDALVGKYEADRATIERDVLALLETLVAEGLVIPAS